MLIPSLTTTMIFLALVFFCMESKSRFLAEPSKGFNNEAPIVKSDPFLKNFRLSIVRVLLG